MNQLPVYRFDDGHVITRKVTEHPGESGSKFFLFKDIDDIYDSELSLSSILIKYLPSTGAADPLGRLLMRRARPHTPYWWTFGIEMLFLADKLPDGQWGMLHVPIVYDDRVHERLSSGPHKEAYDQAMEQIKRWYDARERGLRMSVGQLQELRERAKRAAIDFAVNAFEGIYTIYNVVYDLGTVEVGIPGVARTIIAWEGETGYGESWHINPNGYAASTLLEAIRGFTEFEPIRLGPLLTAEERDQWGHVDGEPVFDVDVYLALGTPSPVLWQREKFKAWYAMMSGEEP